jgi:hypothetical protein
MFTPESVAGRGHVSQGRRSRVGARLVGTIDRLDWALGIE